MATKMLDAFISLFADDKALRQSFQGLESHAFRAGTVVGGRFSDGTRKAAEKAHEAFRKEFIGPLQSEAAGTGIGRGMEPRPAEQFRASDLAAHKGLALVVRDQNKALGENARAQGGAGQAAQRTGDHVRNAASEFREGLLISKRLSGVLLSELSPALGAVAQNALASGLRLGLAAGAVVAVAAVLGKYIEQAKEATETTFRISQALKNLDAGGAEAQFAKTREGIERLGLSWDQLTGKVKAGWWEKIVAGLDVIGERITSTVQGRFGSVLRDTATNIEIASRITIPKAQAGERAFNAGLLEREAQLNISNAKTVEELNAAYGKSAQAIRDRTAAEISQLQTQLLADTAAGKTAAAALAQIEINKKLGAQAADLAAKETERQRALMRAMDERQAHAVALGRVSMRDQLDFERAAMGDPRRTLQEQQAAEVKAFQTQRSMAEAILTFQSQITGKSMFKENIEVARGFMSELVTGSAAWFAQVSKVSDLFTRMREQARAIFSQQAGIAESEASRQGMTTISVDDIGDLVRRARERDERALSGARVPIGELSGAVSRVDLFRTMDREGLSPREAFSRLMEDPSKQLARALEGLTGGAGETTPILTGLADAATLATRALLGLAGASPGGGGGQAGPGLVRRPPGGPPLSEENRQAIMDAISTRLQDEQLAVFGRR